MTNEEKRKIVEKRMKKYRLFRKLALFLTSIAAFCLFLNIFVGPGFWSGYAVLSCAITGSVLYLILIRAARMDFLNFKSMEKKIMQQIMDELDEEN